MSQHEKKISRQVHITSHHAALKYSRILIAENFTKFEVFMKIIEAKFFSWHGHQTFRVANSQEYYPINFQKIRKKIIQLTSKKKARCLQIYSTYGTYGKFSRVWHSIAPSIHYLLCMLACSFTPPLLTLRANNWSMHAVTGMEYINIEQHSCMHTRCNTWRA